MSEETSLLLLVGDSDSEIYLDDALEIDTFILWRDAREWKPEHPKDLNETVTVSKTARVWGAVVEEGRFCTKTKSGALRPFEETRVGEGKSPPILRVKVL